MAKVTLDDIKAEESRRHLLNFTVNNHHDFKVGWFHKILCSRLEKFYQDVIDGKCPRLMILAPPRHGKTEIVSRMFPAWMFGKNPNLNVIATSYASALAERNCRDVQRIMFSETYARTFPSSALREKHERVDGLGSQRNNEIFEILGSRGTYRAAGVGGGITGMGFDIGIIDDPFKDHEEAYSETIRSKVWDWYSTTFFTRKSPMHGILIIMTSWHADDLCQKLLETEPDKWDVLKFKAIATEDEEHRKAGEALHPERYPIDQLLEFQQKYPIFFSAMYQQEPILSSGNLFKKEMFELGIMPIKFDYTFITADTAYKDKQENDFNVFCAWGVLAGELYWIDTLRLKINASELEGPACGFIRQYMGYGFRGAYIEPKGHGIYLNQKLPSFGVLIPGESALKEFYADRSKNKVERANNIIPYLGNHKIRINWNMNEKDNALQEVLAFPKAKHDDVTDCVIDAVKFTFARSISSFDVL